jgi:MYXO-CTERM domain-containing protein
MRIATLFGGAAALLMLAGAAQANLLANNSFEAPDASAGDVDFEFGDGNWFGFGAPGTKFLTQTVPAQDGAQSLKMFGPFDFPGGGTGVGQTFPAAPGQTWIGEVYSRNDSSDPITGDNFAVMKIEFLDAGFNLAAGGLAGVDVFEVPIGDANSPLDTWMFNGVGSAPAPAGTAFANFILVHVQGGQEPITGGSIFLDNASFVPTPGVAGLLALGGLAATRRRRA